MIARFIGILILWFLFFAIDYMAANARRQREIVRKLQRPRLEAVVENDTRSGWQRFFHWQIKPRK